jgi:hypothetical protein
LTVSTDSRRAAVRRLALGAAGAVAAAACSLVVGDVHGHHAPYDSADASDADASTDASDDASMDASPSPAPPPDASADGAAEASDASAPPGDAPADVTPPIDASPDASDSGMLDLIDDMSSDNGLILMTEGRNGVWFAFNDGTGTVTPAQASLILPVALTPPQTFSPWGTSQYAMRFYGSGFTQGGGGIGMYFLTPRASYDASRFKGIQFWARIGATGDTGLLTVEFPSAKTSTAGGICTVCNVNFKTTVALSTAWASYTVPFAQTQQSPSAAPHLTSLDTGELYSVIFEVGNNVTFDVYIADVAFTL